MQVWLWWSSGKDSAWALHVLGDDPALQITGLVTTVTADFDRVSMHAVRTEIVRRQAEAAGLPLHLVEIPYPCDNATYEARARSLIEAARSSGVRAMAFGDLFLEDVRAYREDLLAGSGIEPMFPLWGLDTAELSAAMITGGLEATVTCVDPGQLAVTFAGRAYDASFLEDLPAEVDPCGENGEFHTCATAGPMFSGRIEVCPGKILTRDGFVFADLLPCAGAISTPPA
ncbi:MAG: ATP-binding protein [Gemmatimonadota bacterium]